jgi:hypothetical protein
VVKKTYNIVQKCVLAGFEIKTPDELYLFGRLTSVEVFLVCVFWLLAHCRVIAAYRVITWRYRPDSGSDIVSGRTKTQAGAKVRAGSKGTAYHQQKRLSFFRVRFFFWASTITCFHHE